MLPWQFDRDRAAGRTKGSAAVVLAAAMLVLWAAASAAMAANEQEQPQEQLAAQALDAESPQAEQRPVPGGRALLGAVIGRPDDAEGAEVLRLWPGGPADEAGMERGDRIVRIGEEEVASPEALRSVVIGRAPGDEVEFGVVRDGQLETMTVRLGGMALFRSRPRLRLRLRAPEETAWLGVRLSPEPPAEQRGVLVERVFPRSPAAEAGLQGGDVVVRVDKTRVEAPADLQAAIAGRRPEETARLVVRRDGERHTVKVMLGTFAEWRFRIVERFDEEVRDALGDLVAAALDMAEDALPADAQRRERIMEEVEIPTLAVVKLRPTEGHQAEGTILLRQTEDGVHLYGEVRGLEPGPRGFHIHEYGDLRGPDGAMAGGHFDPDDLPHGAPGDEEHHAGDMGNIEADENGVAQVDIRAPWLTLHVVIGRSLIVHAEEDDLVTQPTGDAGARAAMGVIGIANPETDEDQEP